MSIENILALIGLAVTIVGGVGVIVKSMLARIIEQMDNQFRELKKNYSEIKQEFVDFRLHVANDYVRAPQLETVCASNTASHSTMHGRIDILNDKVIRIETVQSQCKGCSGKV